ncbi:hypothetical protein [Cupriavidus necator]
MHYANHIVLTMKRCAVGFCPEIPAIGRGDDAPMATFPLPMATLDKPIRESEQGIASTHHSQKPNLQGLKIRQQTKERAVKDPQIEGDALYWPIYNLDRKNLNARTGQEHAAPKNLITLMRGHESKTMRRASAGEAPLIEVQA